MSSPCDQSHEQSLGSHKEVRGGCLGLEGLPRARGGGSQTIVCIVQEWSEVEINRQWPHPPQAGHIRTEQH